MIDLALWIAILLASLACLVKAADVFVSNAEKVGLWFGLSPFLIGVTIVALGTSFPELVASVTAVLRGASEIAVATVVGSNITNLLLVLSAAAIAGGGFNVAYELVRVDLPFLFGSTLLLALFALTGSIGWIEGLLSLTALGIYLTYATTAKDEPTTTVEFAAAEVVTEPQTVTLRTWIALPLSAAFVHFGAHYCVESVVKLSEIAEIGAEVIAASAIALGTSLPELIVSVQSAREGKPEVAIGNVIGSNVFNALGVVGVAALFGSLTVPATISGFALPALFAVTVLAFFVLQEREMTRWDGWLLLVLYVGFVLELYGLSD